MNQGKEEVYRFKDKIFYGKQAFMRAFMEIFEFEQVWFGHSW